MTEIIIPSSPTTNPDSSSQRIPNIRDVRLRDIPVSLIEPFTGVPDFFTAYRMPYWVVIQKGEKYLAIGGNQNFQVGSIPLETARCLEYVLSDNSYESIAIEKIALFVKPAGGKATFAELVRAVAALIVFIKTLPDTTVIDGWGGLRRGKEFDDGETLAQLLADRLGKSIDTTRKYIYFGKYLAQNVLDVLAKGNAGRKFFDFILPQKTKLIDSCSGKSAEEITTVVSAEVPKWWTEYSTPKVSKPKQQEIKEPVPGNNGKATQQQGVPVGQGSQTTGQQPVGQTTAPVDQQATEEPADPQAAGTPAGQQQAADESQNPAAGQPDAPADPQEADPDQPTEIGDNAIPVEEDPVEETEEANDITSGKDQRPPLNLVVVQGGKSDAAPDIYAEMIKIGTKLINASNEKPLNEALYKKIQEVMAELTVLLQWASQINRSLPTITLAGGM
ncbi:MAG: hypothetical protein ACOYOS_09155 [Syntrophales bacterium]